jgi:type III restriction enzyme
VATPINTLTGDIPLQLAKTLTCKVDELWQSGEFLTLVTPTTADLLKFWFCEPHTTQREINFHRGQKNAILNTIYLHEILKVDSVLEIYEKCDKELIPKFNHTLLAKEKYKIPKYAMKMATGTGKTWVMNALFVWQYLNARAEKERSGRFTKNFLLIAPGLIVYERLLDSYMGKEREDKSRDVNTSDIFKNRELFLPQRYEVTIKAFLQSSVVKKDEIGKKITSDGFIAISNWHLFMGKDEEKEEISPLDDPSGVIADIFPARPGVSAGNSLEQLDGAYFSGGEIEYLAELDDLVVMNDEAHHIHENKTAGEIQEVEWQKSLNFIAKNKGSKFVQIDFSATPYDTTGSGQNRAKHYFPHVIVDFDLNAAIKDGLVKMITIDKRKELSTLELDFKALRNEGTNKVIGLSDGQRVMIQAGLTKLKILEKDFSKLDSPKHPKMLIMCEETEVVRYVEEFLVEIGLKDDEFMGVHSKKNGEIPKEEWERLKQKLFNIDSYENPKVVISVLMLKEGFDVSNVCVIVPLRSNQSSILLEQTIGRGLRLMFREREFEDEKNENRSRVLKQKLSPSSYLDVLSIVEHPAFSQFYGDLLSEDEFGFDENEPREGTSTGDMIKVGLKENYEDYDMAFLEIIKDEEEELNAPEFDVNALPPYIYHSLEQLKSWTTKGEVFHSEELTVKTTFGDYMISADLFTANSYNEYLQKILEILTHKMGQLRVRGNNRALPSMQIYQPQLLGVLDRYIRERLFSQSFNPFLDENWRVLMLKNAKITEHITNEIHRLIYNAQNSTTYIKPVVNKIYFSKVASLNMRANYALDLQKTIYEKTAYPSNKGGFEKAFLEYLDTDSKVLKFIKILEFKHDFATISYFRDDGLMASYYPDFMVETDLHVHLVETKSDKDLKDVNVKQKQRATLDFVRRINSLDEELREGKAWSYLLLGETQFYSLKKSGADIEDIARSAKINESSLSGSLFDY